MDIIDVEFSGKTEIIENNFYNLLRIKKLKNFDELKFYENNFFIIPEIDNKSIIEKNNINNIN